MLHKTLELLAAARSQIASQAQSGAGQHQISPEPSPEARAAERTIEYLREDLEIRSEQLATAQQALVDKQIEMDRATAAAAAAASRAQVSTVTMCPVTSPDSELSSG